MLRQWTKPIATLILIATAVVAVPGCLTDEQLAHTKAKVAELDQYVQTWAPKIEQAIDQREELDQLLADLPEDDKIAEQIRNVRDDLDQFITTVSPKIQLARETSSRLNAQLANAEDVGDLVSGGASAIGPALPPPWNTIVISAGGAIGVGLSYFFGAKRGKKKGEEIVDEVSDAAFNNGQSIGRLEGENKLEQVVRSIEEAKEAAGGVVDFKNERVRKIVDTYQDPEVKTLVEKARKRVAREKAVQKLNN
jgi:low affinity Fe/Cu permease